MSSPVTVTRIQNRRGLQTQFEALYPPGYTAPPFNGTGGFGSIPGYTLAAYPDVLLPGELAFCTDSRRMFLGNINGEYVEIALTGGDPGTLNPITSVLAPAAVFTTIPELSLTPGKTPFFKVEYSLTDSPNPDWNTVGTNFARNGELEITAVTSIPTLTDTSTEINLTAFNVSFQAVFAGGNIEIQYMHDFAGPLTFNTSTIKWSAF